MPKYNPDTSGTAAPSGGPGQNIRPAKNPVVGALPTKNMKITKRKGVKSGGVTQNPRKASVKVNYNRDAP